MKNFIEKLPIKILLIVLGVISMVFGIAFTVRYTVNANFVKSFENGNYSTVGERLLLLSNMPEGYVTYYNLGNASYRNQNYEEAIVSYQHALKYKIPEGKECPIRINLALALLSLKDFDHLEPSEIDDAIKILKTARGMLTEVGCADPDGTNGHNADAEKLKQEIDELLKKLEKQQSENNNDDQKDDQKDDNKDDQKDDDKKKEGQNTTQSQSPSQSKKDQRVKKEIEKRKEEAQKKYTKDQNQKEKSGSSNNGNGNNSNSNNNGKIW